MDAVETVGAAHTKSNKNRVMARALPEPRAVLELLKPITWFAPMWALGCGVVSAGVPFSEHWTTILATIVLAGPLACGTSQAVNDWFDRHVDAINEPDRPIPSGRIPGRWGLWIAIGWSVMSMIVAYAIGPWVAIANAIGLAFSWAYSAPPFRLKTNGWFGAAAAGLCYEGLPWFTGAAALTYQLPDARITWLALLYSAGAFGIMVLNDFKAVEGDIKLGVRTLPVQLGVKRAAWFACFVMAVPQVVVIAMMVSIDQRWAAYTVSGLLLAQIAMMPILIRNPREKAPLYNATGTTFYVLGMLASAIAIRQVLLA
jgi:chlorophyll synthase